MICCELNQRLLPLVLERETQELKKTDHEASVEGWFGFMGPLSIPALGYAGGACSQNTRTRNDTEESAPQGRVAKTNSEDAL